jgi:hypothetical protein
MADQIDDAHVSDVVVESTRDTILSRIIRLRLSYQGAPDAPRSLILKTARPERKGIGGGEGGKQEVAFYNQIAPAMATAPVPRCFDAQWDGETKAWHILLEDLNESHLVPTVWPMPPTMAQCESIMRARARFHAAWWNNARLGVSINPNYG